MKPPASQRPQTARLRVSTGQNASKALSGPANPLQLAVNSRSKRGHRAILTNAAEHARGSGTLDKHTIADAQAVKVWRSLRGGMVRSLSPQELVTALEGFEAGYLHMAADLWEKQARRDDIIASVRPKREDAVTRRPFEVLLADNVKGKAAEEQKAALEYFWGNCTAVNAFDRNVTGGFSQVVRFIMRTIGYRYGAQHIVWQPSTRLHRVTACFEHVPLSFFENQTGSLRYLGGNGFMGGMEGTDLDPQNWLVTGRDAGLMEPCSVAATLKGASWVDWIVYNEKFGIPFVLGKCNAPKDSPEWEAMVEAVGAFMNDGGAVISEGADFKLVDGGKASGALPFQGLIERCDRALSTLWVGSDLSTMSRGGSENAGASTQMGEAVKLEAGDCEWVSEQMQRVDKLVLEYLYGYGVEQLAYSQIRGPVIADATKEMAIDTFLIKHGVRISRSNLAERYERSEAADDEAVAEAPKRLAREETEPAINERTNARADAAAEQVLREAINADLKPVYEALARLLADSSDDELPANLKKLADTWPALTDAVLNGSSLETALETFFGAAFIKGLDARTLLEASN